jgi:putative NIF3 family GTP cyclohydrolase 1 type 2
MKVKTITSYLESIAPLSLQEDYDNSGLLIGSEENEISGVLVTLDCTEEVLEEAIKKNCNLIIAHHPIIFKGLKKMG